MNSHTLCTSYKSLNVTNTEYCSYITVYRAYMTNMYIVSVLVHVCYSARNPVTKEQNNWHHQVHQLV